MPYWFYESQVNLQCHHNYIYLTAFSCMKVAYPSAALSPVSAASWFMVCICYVANRVAMYGAQNQILCVGTVVSNFIMTSFFR